MRFLSARNGLVYTMFASAYTMAMGGRTRERPDDLRNYEVPLHGYWAFFKGHFIPWYIVNVSNRYLQQCTMPLIVKKQFNKFVYFNN